MRTYDEIFKQEKADEIRQLVCTFMHRPELRYVDFSFLVDGLFSEIDFLRAGVKPHEIEPIKAAIRLGNLIGNRFKAYEDLESCGLTKLI